MEHAEREILSNLFIGPDAPLSEFVLTSKVACSEKFTNVARFLFPIDIVISFLKSMARNDVRRPNYLVHIAKRILSPCIITEQEDARLTSGRQSNEEERFSVYLYDRLARFELADNDFGEPGYTEYGDLPEIVRDSRDQFYVYRMYTPKGGLFYIGKGLGKRIMQHERELLKKWFPVHTNWKKLNKISQILRSNKGVLYKIDSWHQCEESAFLREDELILIHERANPWLLANSNGNRWRGGPSKKFNEWRLNNGLEAL